MPQTSTQKHLILLSLGFLFFQNTGFAKKTDTIPKENNFAYTTFLFKNSVIADLLIQDETSVPLAINAFLLIDTDGDTVDNSTDLDDDNDGILDEVENTCSLISGYDAYWNYDDTANDISGNGHNLQNSPTLVYNANSVSGTKSLEFDGSSTMLQYSDGTFLNQAIANFTYSFWIYPETLSGEQTLIEEGATGRGFAIRLNGSTLECAVRSSGTTHTTSTFTIGAINTWYHIAATYASGNLTLFLNGIPTSTLSTGIGTLTSHGNGSGFGATNSNSAFNSGSGHYFDGLMDEILHYPIALSSTQINQLKNSPSCTPEDSDSDGIDDYLDLDSDNDGIPDNIEAQATNSYVAPNADTPANYVTNNGVNSAYLAGLTPPNTDGDANADYKDSDSDNEGDSDTIEAGYALSGTVGTNGLDSNYESADTYTDPNGTLNDPTTLPDGDSDLGSGGDVNYRDNSVSVPFNFTSGASAATLGATIEGPGVTISSPTVTQGNSTQVGTFEGAIQGINIEIDDGIILTTGTVNESFSTNSSGSSTTDHNTTTNDADLDILANGSMNDPVIFEFDAVLGPLATVLTIDYQFGSDEYNEYVCSNFNDVFGYFVSGNGIVGTKNIATVPGTTNTVSINNVNNGSVGANGNIANCGDLTQASYFIDNTSGSITMEYDGFTTKIRASAKGLTPGETYHVKFAITDVSDNSYDSAILIKLISGFPDSDDDGIADDADIDDDNDGILDTVEDANLDNDNNPLTDPTDTDLDGQYNYLDLDSDGDGIPDNIEAQTTIGYILPNGTYDGNGLDTAYTGGLTPINTDGTDNDDYLDTDSDNEGANDTTEAGLTLNGNVGENGLDNNIDNGDDFTDVNGTINDPTTLPDADGDYNSGGDVDYRDALVSGDNDGDGVDDSTDLDDDNDGILDTVEGEILDTDLDGIKNYLDLDSDGDGIPDNIEAQATSSYITPNNTYNATGIDTAYPSGLTPVNTDGTDNTDYLDTDSDNEGANDTTEAGLTLSGALGINGLDSNIYTSNDYSDVNGTINTPTSLPDSDSDIGTGGDVDFRDDTINVTSGVGNTLWLRADIGVIGGSSVTQWTDQSDANDNSNFTDDNNFTGAGGTTPDATSTTLNFNPVITFSPGNNDELTFNGNMNPRTMYIVYNDISTASWTTPFTNSSDNIGHGHSSDTQVFNSSFTPADVRNGANYVNGLTTTLTSHLRPDNFELHSRIFDTNLSNETTNYYIGNDRSNSGRTINGNVAEIMLFTDNHTVAEKQVIESYLGIKYGITLDDTNNSGSIIEGDYVLSNGSTKVWSYDNNSAHHNDVAGIGKDATRNFEQKQSKSVNSDALVTIGLGTIASDNLSNANSFVTDKDFLMWGNDNGSGTSTATSVLCSSSKIMNRIWKVVETGSVGTIQIAAPEASIRTDLNTTPTIEIAIKVADNAALTTNVEFISLSSSTIDGITQLNGTYDFDGTKYFTFTEVSGITWKGGTSSWNGGSSGTVSGAPNDTDDGKLVTIDSEGTSNHATLTENVEIGCMWIKPGSTLTINTSLYLEIADDLQLDGDLRMVGSAQLIQTHTGNSKVSGSGKFYIDQKGTTETVYRYNYFTSPVVTIGETTFTVQDILKDGTIPTSATSTPPNITFQSYTGAYNTLNGSNATSPITIANYWIYSYINGLTGTSWIQELETGSFSPGEAFILKGPGAVQNYTFVGTPNDGDYSSPISAGHSSLLGNPYPSAIDSNTFISDNPSISTLFFWEHTGDSNNHTQGGYEGGYGTRNAATGSAATTPVDGTAGLGSGTYHAPARYIPVGQGFFTQSGLVTGNVNFKNSYRVNEPLGPNSIFFKGKKKGYKIQENEPNLSILKLGFDYLNNDGVDLHRQLAVSFKEGNSFNRDEGYDSQMFDLGETDIYLKFENNREVYVIAGIQELNTELEVPLTIKTDYDGTTYLMIDELINIDQPVYLKDNTDNSYKDLKLAPVTLNLSKGTYTDRFSIVFQNDNALSNNHVDTVNLKINYNKDEHKLKLLHNNSISISEIEMINSLGQQIKDWKPSQKELSTKSIPNGIYFLKINTSKGKISRKIAIY